MAVVRLKLANGRQTWGDASNPEVIKEIEKQYNSKVVEADGKKFASGGLTEKQQEKVGKVMHEFKEGKLHSGSKEGPIVKDRKQAIAIALSEANNSPKYTTGGKIQVDAYDEEKYPSGIEYLRSIITKYFGPKNIHYSSADWGGIDNWTIIGTKHYGIFIVIDDNQNVILMLREFDEQSDENVDTEIAQADPDDTNGLEKLFEKAMKIKNNQAEYGVRVRKKSSPITDEAIYNDLLDEREDLRKLANEVTTRMPNDANHEDRKALASNLNYEANQLVSINKQFLPNLSNFAERGTKTNTMNERVAEVNELIKQGNEKGIEVTNKSSTWQSPMKYKPFTYSNGVLYEQYEELDLYKANKGQGREWKLVKNKYTKSGDGVETQRAVLTDVARMYRNALKSIEKYGYYDEGGATGEMKMLWYVTDANNNVKNISTSKEKAEVFLANSLKYNGAINYVKVPLSDWNAEKINTSNIKQIAKKFWQKYEDGGQTGGTSDSSMPGMDDVFLGGTMASSMAKRGKKVTEKMYKIVDIDGAGDNKVYSASDIIDYANTITYYERMDNDEPEITDFALAKKVIEMEGDYKVKQVAMNGTMTELSDLYFVKDKHGNRTGIYNQSELERSSLKKLDRNEEQTIQDFMQNSIAGDIFEGEGFTIENLGHDIMATGGVINGHPYLHYDEVEGNYMLKNAILVKKPITKYQKEVEPDYFIVQLTYDKTSNDFMVDWYGTDSKGSHAYHKDFASAKKHMINVIKYIRNEWDIADVRYDVEYDEYNDADFGKGYSAPEVKAERGMVINENAEMILNNNKQIAHHTKELAEVVNKDTHVPAWVVAKTFRSATDLSDVTHYLEGNSNKFAKGGWTEYLDKAKNYGKRAYQVAKENYGKAKAYTQQKIRDKQKQIALDVLYETKENLATGRDEHIAMEKAFHIVDEKFAGGGAIGNYYLVSKHPIDYYTYETPKITIEWKGKTQPRGFFKSAKDALEEIKKQQSFVTMYEPTLWSIRTPEETLTFKWKDKREFAGGGMIDYSKEGNVKAIRDANGKIVYEINVNGELYKYNKVYKTYNSTKDNSLLNKTKYAGGGSTKPEKIKVAFYKWGEYQGDEEIDLIDLPERELTSDELMGFDIREEDENKHFYANELDIDDTNVEEEGYGVKRAYATDKQYN